MREMIVFALVALLSEAVVPSVVQFAAARNASRPEAEEESEPQDSAEQGDDEEDADSVAQLEEDNRILKELVGEKELALRRKELEEG